MVHALRRVGQQLEAGGTLVLLQPHHKRRPTVGIKAGARRTPIATLINPAFQPLVESAMASIRRVIAAGDFEQVGKANHRFRVELFSISELDRYMHLSQRPPRFPPNGRKRLLDHWTRRSSGALIEVSEYFTVIALRPLVG
jgi:hypothetical protein